MIEFVATDKCVFGIPNPIAKDSTMHLLGYIVLSFWCYAYQLFFSPNRGRASFRKD